MHQERTPQARARSTPIGIAARHSRSCSHRETRCSCKPRYQAQVWSVRDKKVIRKTFPTLSAAKAWRQDASVALRRRTMQAPSQTTV